MPLKLLCFEELFRLGKLLVAVLIVVQRVAHEGGGFVLAGVVERMVQLVQVLAVVLVVLDHIAEQGKVLLVGVRGRAAVVVGVRMRVLSAVLVVMGMFKIANNGQSPL